VSHAHVALDVPGTTTEDLQAWAKSIAEANPISSTLMTDESVQMLVVDELFMGVELALVAGERRLLTLALFATIANEEERAVMEDKRGVA